MLRPLLSVGKMVAALVVLTISVFTSVPVILFVCFFWCGWLWFVVHSWKGRLLATLGFALTPLGWWFCFPLWNYLARKGEASHFSEAGAYWAVMANTDFWVGIGLMTAGVLLLTYVDYQRPSKSKQASGLSNEAEADQDRVWPPAPKQSQ